MKPKPRKRKARRDGRQADGSIRFTMTKAINKEALRNVMVFGPPFGRFNPVVVGLLNATTDGWPLVGSEEMDIDHSPLANELRTAYITNSKIYDAGKITAEQFRAAVCPLFDRLTNKTEREKMD